MVLSIIRMDEKGMLGLRQIEDYLCNSRNTSFLYPTTPQSSDLSHHLPELLANKLSRLLTIVIILEVRPTILEGTGS